MKRALLPLLAVVALVGCASPADSVVEAASSVETTATTPRLREAAYTCGVHVSALMDDGASMMLDGAGKDDLFSDSHTHSHEETTCILEEIGTPESIVGKMNQTRALDGMQTDSDGSFEYTWTYHPDDGLDIIITAID